VVKFICNMTREEFDQRKQRLEEQLQEGIELLRAGFHQQLRALELVWGNTAEGAEALASAPPAGTRREQPAAPVQTSAAPPPATPSSSKRGQLWRDIDAILDDLPQVFNRDDLVKALGYEPDPSALHRALRGLRRAGVIVLKARSVGKYPADYELVVEEEEEAEDVAAEGPGDQDLPAG
jgi:hypothetical protein